MRGETKAQKMARLAAQDRAGAAILRVRGVTDHADALDKRAAQREKSATEVANIKGRDHGRR